MTDERTTTAESRQSQDGAPARRGPSVAPDEHRRSLAREAVASALYLDLVLLGTLIALPQTRLPSDQVLVQLIFGAGLGLVVAHWVAFRLAAPLTSERGAWSGAAAQEASAAMVGGLVTAVLAALPFMVLDGDVALISSLVLLASMPAVVGALVSRLRGWSWSRTFMSAVTALVVAAAAVVLKAVLGH